MNRVNFTFNARITFASGELIRILWNYHRSLNEFILKNKTNAHVPSSDLTRFLPDDGSA